MYASFSMSVAHCPAVDVVSDCRSQFCPGFRPGRGLGKIVRPDGPSKRPDSLFEVQLRISAWNHTQRRRLRCRGIQSGLPERHPECAGSRRADQHCLCFPAAANILSSSPCDDSDCRQQPAAGFFGYLGKLYINTDPPGASIRFVTISYKYKPASFSAKGTYLVEVSHPGFPSIQKELTVVPGIDNRFLLRMNDPVEKAEAMQIPPRELPTTRAGSLSSPTRPESPYAF